MTERNNFAKRLLLTTTAALLLVGTVLVWASQSWFALVWAQAHAAFPGAGVRVFMVNTEATLPLREKYSLPENLVHNIALRALVVDKQDRVVAFTYREPSLIPYPEGNRGINTYYYFFMRAIAWGEACRAIGFGMIGIGSLQALAFITLWFTNRCKDGIR